MVSDTSDVVSETSPEVQAVVREESSAVAELHPLDWDSPEKLKLLIEGAIFASQEPVTVKVIQTLFPEWARPSAREIKDILDELADDYRDRAVQLQNTPIGYRFQVRQAATPLVKSMLTEKPPKYSRASLETLALIAYRQPITRGEIEEVRGVGVSSQIMRTMEERGWIRVVGHKELPGRPSLWATTPEFLAYFGLNSLDELPPLTEIQSLDIDKNCKQNATIDRKSEILEEGADNLGDESEEQAMVLSVDAEPGHTPISLLQEQCPEQDTLPQGVGSQELNTNMFQDGALLEGAEDTSDQKLDEVDYSGLFDRLRQSSDDSAEKEQ